MVALFALFSFGSAVIPPSSPANALLTSRFSCASPEEATHLAVPGNSNLDDTLQSIRDVLSEMDFTDMLDEIKRSIPANEFRMALTMVQDTWGRSVLNQSCLRQQCALLLHCHSPVLHTSIAWLSWQGYVKLISVCISQDMR